MRWPTEVRSPGARVDHAGILVIGRARRSRAGLLRWVRLLEGVFRLDYVNHLMNAVDRVHERES